MNMVKKIFVVLFLLTAFLCHAELRAQFTSPYAKNEEEAQAHGNAIADAVSLEITNEQGIKKGCAGAVIADGWILTASHCVVHCTESSLCEALVSYVDDKGGLAASKLSYMHKGRDIFAKGGFVTPEEYVQKKLVTTFGGYVNEVLLHDIALLRFPGKKPAGKKIFEVVSREKFKDDGGAFSVILPNKAGQKDIGFSYYKDPLSWTGFNFLAIGLNTGDVVPGHSGTVVLHPSGQVVGVIVMISGEWGETVNSAAIVPLNESNLKFVLETIKK